MAITYTSKAYEDGLIVTPMFVERVLVEFDDTYATGGVAMDLAAEVSRLTNLTIKSVFVAGLSGYVGVWDHDAGKLMVYYAEYTAGADGPLIEFPPGALTANFMLTVICT